MKIIVTDIESNGLLRQDGAKFHCAWVADISEGDEPVMLGFRPEQVKEYITYLSDADIIIGHNSMGFDIPFLRLYCGLKYEGVQLDTMHMYRFLDPSRKNSSLKALAKEAKGQGKTSFDDAEDENEQWAEFTEGMYNYCKDDVLATLSGFLYLTKRLSFNFRDEDVVQEYLFFNGDINAIKRKQQGTAA